MTGQMSGATDVRDYQDRVVGGWVSRSAGGWTLVGHRTLKQGADMGGANLSAWGITVGKRHAASKVLTIGQTHETGTCPSPHALC